MQPFASTSSSSSVDSDSTISASVSTPATASTTFGSSSHNHANGYGANGKERERTTSSSSNSGFIDGESMGSLSIQEQEQERGQRGNGNEDGNDDRGLLEYIVSLSVFWDESWSPGTVAADPVAYADLPPNIKYQRGFINGEFNDVQLHYRHDRPPLKLHSLIISQSPVLEKEFSYSQQSQSSSNPLNILFDLQGHEEITDEAFQLSISYLYSSRAFGHVTPSNAPSVLSAASLLQLPKLADYAFKLCKDSIGNIVSPNEVKYWIAYLERLQSKDGAGKGKEGGYARELQEDLLHRLTTSLPLSLHAFSTTSPIAQQASSQLILQHIYSVLPFETFKSIIESPSLRTEEGEVLSDQTRFGLAKKCILERKKLQAKGDGQGIREAEEETVVLAFGAGNGKSNVQVVRKPKQTRKLWKVNG